MTQLLTGMESMESRSAKNIIYIFFSNRKAVELLWKSYEQSRTLTKEEVRASNTCLELLAKKTLPTVKAVHKWYKDLKSYPKVHSNIDVMHKGLEEILEHFQHGRTVGKNG